MSKKKRASFFEEKKDETASDKDSAFPPSEDQQPVPAPPAMATPTGGTDQMALLSQMMQTFQSMVSGGAFPSQWSSSSPFQSTTTTAIEPEAVPHDIVFPKTLERGITVQKGLDVHPLFSKLFVNSDGSLLHGIPAGCTIALTGPAYSGKTRSALEMVVHAVMKGVRTAYVVAEEGFYDNKNVGRNDLFSRFLQIATSVSGLSEEEFRRKYDESYLIIPNQYHLGKTWADFIRD